jgi:hypothetical protein
LLRARREWPCGCRAAKQANEFSPADANCHAPLLRGSCRRGRYHTRACCAAGIRPGLRQVRSRPQLQCSKNGAPFTRSTRRRWRAGSPERQVPATISNIMVRF